MIAALFLAVSGSDAPVVPLDEGTWVRPSLSVLPVAVAPCVPTPPRRMLEEWRSEHPAKGKRKPTPPGEGRLRELAAGRDRMCEEVRREAEAGGKDWTGLPSQHRFDANPLPDDLETRAHEALEKGFGQLDRVLPSLAEPLGSWLSGSALDRARHLESDFQKNSMVAEKAHEDDIVAAQTARVRDAAWILAERIEGLQLRRTKAGWSISGRRRLGMWHFEAARSGFRQRLGREEGFETEIVDPSRAAAAAFGAGSFDAVLRGFEDFRFTAQMDSSSRGMRPAARIESDTEADLRSGRRFVYRERVREQDGSTRWEQVGYGFLESGSGDSWTLRHIGGRDPYDGLVAREVPGDLWWVLGVERTPWQVEGAGAGSGPSMRVDGTPVGWGLRGGWRGHVPGDLPGQFLYLDLAGSWNSLEGKVEETDGSWEYERRLGGGWMADLSAGWLRRWNLRRLFLVGGAGMGARWLGIAFSGEAGAAGTGGSGWDPALQQASGLSAWQPHLDLVAGAQLSATVASGLGFQVRWEAWSGAPDWKASGSSGDIGSLSGSIRPGRLSLCLQWVGG